MKVLTKKPELCIQCHACETACSNTWFKEDNADKSCIRIKDENNQAKITACTQCGECLPICPVEALTRDKNGVIRIDKKACVGCFMCVGFCPELSMMMHEAHIEPFKCTACGQCAKACPAGALEIAQ